MHNSHEVGYAAQIWIVLHTVEYIHNRRAMTLTAYVVVTCARLLAYKISNRTPKPSAEKHFGEYQITLHISASA